MLPSNRPSGRAAAVVLAAGAATRFGGGKVVAPLDGQPLLQHVLDAIADAGLRDAVVVTPPDAEAIDAVVRWRDERRVANPRPADGLASSLSVGLSVLGPEIGAAIVLLADQPRVRPIVIRRIVDAWRAGAGPIVAPRYSQDAAPNPVLIDRIAWPLAFALRGDRGFGPVLRERERLVHWLSVAGENPDVDTRADLERLGGSGEGSR